MKKLLCIVIAIILMCGMSACVKKDEKGALIINVYSGGYGTTWVDAMSNAFSAKSGKTVKVNKFPGKNGILSIRTELLSGTSASDLIITKDIMFDEIYRGKKQFGNTSYDCIFEDLSGMYDEKITGENLTLREKMYPNYSEFYQMDNKIYFAPWASGMIGLIRNNDVWSNEWNIDGRNYPNTTDELFTMADNIKASVNNTTKFKAPFIYAEEDEYWSMFSHVWVSQYKGSEGMKKFYDGYDEDGERYLSTIFDDNSWNHTLSFYEKLLKNENGYMHEKSRGADFTNMQGMFLQGNAVFTPNGDWIEREMSANYTDVNVEFIKTPIISALSNKLSFKNDTDRDSKLSTIVTYVDENKSGYDNKPAFATNEDIDIVRDARSIEYTVGNEHFMAVPAYSNEKELAKEFMQFMASDEGIKIYTMATGGCTLPYEYDYANDGITRSTFRQATTNIITKSKLMFSSKKNKLFSIGGVDMYWHNDPSKGLVIPSLSATNSKDYKNAETIIKNNNAYLEKNWKIIKSNAGL